MPLNAESSRGYYCQAGSRRANFGEPQLLVDKRQLPPSIFAPEYVAASFATPKS
jgi:hypothetical protein